MQQYCILTSNFVTNIDLTNFVNCVLTTGARAIKRRRASGPFVVDSRFGPCSPGIKALKTYDI